MVRETRTTFEEAVMLLDRVRDESFDATGDHSDNPRGPLGRRQRRRMVALALSSVLAVVVPLALASPPDSMTVDSVYDAADYDDVVVLLTSQDVLVEGRQLLISRPL